MKLELISNTNLCTILMEHSSCLPNSMPTKPMIVINHVKVLMEKRLEGIHDQTYNETNSSVSYGGNPILDESKTPFKELDEMFNYPEVLSFFP